MSCENSPQHREIDAERSIRVNGMPRTYWDFYVGFGLFESVLLVFSELVCWQLGGLPPAVLKGMPLLTWALAACFIVNAYLAWRHFLRCAVFDCDRDSVELGRLACGANRINFGRLCVPMARPRPSNKWEESHALRPLEPACDAHTFRVAKINL